MSALPAVACERCATNYPHSWAECTAHCAVTGRLHKDMAREKDAALHSTYASYGYWTGRCDHCGKRWELDSSG